MSSYIKDILCIGAGNIQLKEEKAEDIPITCEFRDVFLKNY